MASDVCQRILNLVCFELIASKVCNAFVTIFHEDSHSMQAFYLQLWATMISSMAGPFWPFTSARSISVKLRDFLSYMWSPKRDPEQLALGKAISFVASFFSAVSFRSKLLSNLTTFLHHSFILTLIISFLLRFVRLPLSS